MDIKKHSIIVLILLFCIWNKFFAFKPFVEAQWFRLLSDIFTICFAIGLIKEIFRKKESQSIAKSLSYIFTIFIFSIIWSYFFREQSVYSSIRGLASLLPVTTFFFLLKYKIDNRNVTKAIIILCLLYVVFHLSSLYTYPNNFWGYNEAMQEMAEINIEQRGILRLGTPGADFVIVMIFYVLTNLKRNLWFYLLLILLFALLLIRGTRTPLFVTLSICVVYYLWQMRHKYIAVLWGLVMFVCLNSIYEYLSNSNADNVFTNYVQMTNNQFERNDDKEDIRIEMSKYYFTQFNDNIFETILGNGVPDRGSYGKKVSNLENTHSYYLSDVGITNIFILFGIVGLAAYFFLLWSVIKTKVDSKYMFAKLYVFYAYLILPTNVSLLSIAPMIFAMNLYIVYNGRIRHLYLK